MIDKSSGKDANATAGQTKPLTPADLLVQGCEPKRRYTRAAPANQPEQVAFVRGVGERLKIARELCSMSLAEAASRLGFSTQASLSKLETAKHVATIPLYLLADAARVYEVSTDYLLGITDELRQQARVQTSQDVTRWLHTSMERARRQELEMLNLVHEEVTVALVGLRDVTLLVQEADAAVNRFREINPRFEGMKGGATVLRRMSDAMLGVSRTAAAVTKFKMMMHASRLSAPVEPQTQALFEFSK